MGSNGGLEMYYNHDSYFLQRMYTAELCVVHNALYFTRHEVYQPQYSATVPTHFIFPIGIKNKQTTSYKVNHKITNFDLKQKSIWKPHKNAKVQDYLLNS